MFSPWPRSAPWAAGASLLPQGPQGFPRGISAHPSLPWCLHSCSPGTVSLLSSCSFVPSQARYPSSADVLPAVGPSWSCPGLAPAHKGEFPAASDRSQPCSPHHLKLGHRAQLGSSSEPSAEPWGADALRSSGTHCGFRVLLQHGLGVCPWLCHQSSLCHCFPLMSWGEGNLPGLLSVLRRNVPAITKC